MNRLLIFTIFLLSASAFADTGQERELIGQNEGSSKKQLENLPRCLKNEIPFLDLYENTGINLGVWADLLYMNYSSPNLNIARSVKVEERVETSTVIELPGKMSYGSCIGINYTMPGESGCSFESSWYHIVAQLNNQSQQSFLIFGAFNTVTSSEAGNIFALAHLTLNFFDLLIEKKWGWGDWFSIAPAAGLVGGFMDWKNGFTNFQANGINEITETNTYKGVGLKLGGRSSFKIAGGFKLTADWFYSVLYGFSKNHTFEQNPGIFFSDSKFSEFYKNHHGRCFFDSLIGFAWEKWFRNDSLFFELHAGWKFQSFPDGLFTNVLSPNPLYGQGLQAGAEIKF